MNGKRRAADDLVVPLFFDGAALKGYLSDLCHEWANEKHPDVFRIN